MTTNQTGTVVAIDLQPEKTRFDNILRSRPFVTIEEAREGKKLRCKIVGQPQYDWRDDRVVSKMTGEIAHKDIYSLDMNKAPVAKSAMAQKAYADAVALELAGKPADARKVFDKLLNDIQLNASFIVKPTTKRFQAGEHVDVFITTAMVKDRDPLTKQRLETEHEAIIVETMVGIPTERKTKNADQHDYFGANVEIVNENVAQTNAEIAKEITQVAK